MSMLLMNNRVSGGLAGPALKPAVEVVDVCVETKIFLGEAPSNANTAGQHLHKIHCLVSDLSTHHCSRVDLSALGLLLLWPDLVVLTSVMLLLNNKSLSNSRKKPIATWSLEVNQTRLEYDPSRARGLPGPVTIVTIGFMWSSGIWCLESYLLGQ